MSATRQISIVVVIGLAVFAPACGSDEDQAAEGTGTGGVRGPSSGSCIEEYSPENLRKREFAFDGTISAVSQEMDRLTFSVGEWFKGGSDDSVTLSAMGLVGITSAGDVQVDTGTRMLVSGDDGFAFACGFSVPYTDQVAAEWKAALSS